MPARMRLAPTIHTDRTDTASLGTTSNKFGPTEIGKAVKLIGPDQFGLCSAGDKIEAICTSVETDVGFGGTRGGFTVGGITRQSLLEVVAGVQLAINDRVVAAAQPALGTALTSVGDGAIPATPVQKAAVGDNDTFGYRIVGFGPAGTGAAGTVCIAQAL